MRIKSIIATLIAFAIIGASIPFSYRRYAERQAEAAKDAAIDSSVTYTAYYISSTPFFSAGLGIEDTSMWLSPDSSDTVWGFIDSNDTFRLVSTCRIVIDSLFGYTLLTDFAKVTDDTTKWNAGADTASLVLDSLSNYTLTGDFGKVTDDTTDWNTASDKTDGTTTQWITAALIDSTANTIIVSAIYKITSAVADSQYVTKDYVDNAVSGGGTDYGARAYIASTVTISNASITTINWSNETFDASSKFNLTTDAFVPGAAGKYRVDLHVEWNGDDETGDRMAYIYKNTTAQSTDYRDAGATIGVATYAIENVTHVVSDVIDLGASDSIQCKVQQTSGGNLDLEANRTWVAITKVN